MWTAGLWLFCMTFTLSFYGCIGFLDKELEFFKGDEHTFQCDHGIPFQKITKIIWYVAGDGCAGGGSVANGAITRAWYCDRLKGRSVVTPTNLTISGLQTTEDGEVKCTTEKDFTDPIGEYNTFNVTIKVRPKNHSLLLDGEQHPCNEPVLVSHDGSATLTCAVDSKPEATFKWSSSVAAVVGSKTGVTTCVQRADKVFRCTSTLSLPKADIPLVAVKVTCQVDAVGNRTDLCITIGKEVTTTTSTTTTTTTKPTTPTTTTEPPPSMTVTATPTLLNGTMSANLTTNGNTTTEGSNAGSDSSASAKRLSLWSLTMLLCLTIGSLAPTVAL